MLTGRSSCPGCQQRDREILHLRRRLTLRTEEVQSLAKKAFSAIDAAGVARVDFLLTKEGKAIINEINTLPGSLAFYLWEATNLPFPKLLDRLIEIAIARHEAGKQITYSIDSALLSKTLEGSGKSRPH